MVTSHLPRVSLEWHTSLSNWHLFHIFLVSYLQYFTRGIVSYQWQPLLCFGFWLHFRKTKQWPSLKLLPPSFTCWRKLANWVRKKRLNHSWLLYFPHNPAIRRCPGIFCSCVRNHTLCPMASRAGRRSTRASNNIWSGIRTPRHWSLRSVRLEHLAHGVNFDEFVCCNFTSTG